MRFGLFVVLGALVLSARPYSAQQAAPAATIDFVRDVQPIFRDNCYSCHGPDRQSNGFRLDRRHSAMLGGTEPAIGPGSSQSSKLYLRLIGPEFGEPMPKDGQLTKAQIDTIKTWIDQGAVWPDAASGDVDDTPADTAAVTAVRALQAGRRSAVAASLAADPTLPNRRGPGGSTPLMFAALQSDAVTVRRMLDAGGNPNLANDAGATALMWAVTDLPVARLLVEHGADVNAHSADARTPLLIVSGFPGSTEVARLLLDHGAKPNVHGPWLIDAITPLSEAARVGNADLVALLLERGANVQDAGVLPVALAMRARCDRCVELLAKGAPPGLLGGVMGLASPPLGPALAVLPLLALGGDVHSPNPTGVSLLLAASASDALPVDVVKALLGRGFDVNAQGPGGVTALGLARQRGHTAIVDLLVQAGATNAGPQPSPDLPFDPASSTRAAVARSLPLLQRADVAFLKKSGCVSCHNNSLTAVTVSAARGLSIPVDESTAAAQLRKIGTYVDDWRERTVQGHALPGEGDTVSFILMGMAAERYAPDLTTDAMARYLRLQQASTGGWRIFAHRPPLESSDVEATATAIRALQVYARGVERPLAAAAIARAGAWLGTAPLASNEDRAFQLMGLAWTHANLAAIRPAGRALLAEQRPDGGWAQIPTLESDAYATGQALVALRASGVLTATDAAYRRGTAFLLRTQHADGSWLVRTRALRIQPPLDAGFPYGGDQFVSAAATNWATQALIYATTASAVAPLHP